MSLLGYPKVILYTKFEKFGIICFYAADKQTDKQTEGLDNPTHADRWNRRGYKLHILEDNEANVSRIKSTWRKTVDGILIYTISLSIVTYNGWTQPADNLLFGVD